MLALFRDRTDAGQRLAGALKRFADRGDVLVLALPRGGVPVGYEIATALHVPLDVFLVRKLGVPGQEELAMGAIALGGATVFNDEIVRGLGLAEAAVQRVIAKEQAELDRRNTLYREGRPLPDLAHRTVILVDDGVATGATIRAAAQSIRRLGCRHLVIAVPLAPPSAPALLRAEADDVVCLETPEPFFAIGGWYQYFDQTTDDEVRTLLAKAREARSHDIPPP